MKFKNCHSMVESALFQFCFIGESKIKDSILLFGVKLGRIAMDLLTK